MGSVVFSLIVLWYLQQRAYRHLTEEGYYPNLPSSRTDGAIFLWFCLKIILRKEGVEVKPSRKLLITLWLFVMSYPVIIMFLVMVAYYAKFFGK
jgi:hypothetical protein